MSSALAVKNPPAMTVSYGPQRAESVFRERSRQYGLAGLRGVRFYGVDFDGDTWTDLVLLPDYFAVPEFYLFSPENKRFAPLPYNPFPQPVQGSFLHFIDLNKDGLLDVVVGVLSQKSELVRQAVRVFRGQKREGKLSYVEQQQVLGRKEKEQLTGYPLSSLSAFDYDLDGWLDFFLGGWFIYHKRGGLVSNAPDRLYRGGQGGFQWENRSQLLGTTEGDRPTFASATCDLNFDGYPEILTAASNGYPNQLWLNERGSQNTGGRVFRDIGLESGYAQDERGRLQLRGGGHTFFTACADYNNDSKMDIFLGELSHALDPPTVDRSSVLTGTTRAVPLRFLRTSYTDHERTRWSQGDRRGVWFDYNNDGLLDLLVDNSGFPPNSRLVLFHQLANHAYEDRAEVLGIDTVNPVGSIYLDVNGDGRWDILTGQDNIRDARIPPRLYLFENQVEWQGHRSLRFYLRGKRSNSQGLGAMLVLRTDKGQRWQWVEYHQGPQGSQSAEGIQFGLRPGEQPLQLTVHWPYLQPNKGSVLGKKVSSGARVERVYSLERYQFRQFLSLTLCENGRSQVGRVKGCPES